MHVETCHKSYTCGTRRREVRALIHVFVDTIVTRHITQHNTRREMSHILSHSIHIRMPRTMCDVKCDISPDNVHTYTRMLMHVYAHGNITRHITHDACGQMSRIISHIMCGARRRDVRAFIHVFVDTNFTRHIAHDTGREMSHILSHSIHVCMPRMTRVMWRVTCMNIVMWCLTRMSIMTRDISVHVHMYEHTCVCMHICAETYHAFITHRTHPYATYDAWRDERHVSTHMFIHIHVCSCIYLCTELSHASSHMTREVGGWGRDPKKYTGRDWGMGSSTI